MEPSQIIAYLKDNYPIEAEKLDSIQVVLTEHLYYFGDHFRFPRERSSHDFTRSIRNYLRFLFVNYKIYQNRQKGAGNQIILSSSYFNVNQELKDLGYQVYCPSWEMTADRDVLTSRHIFSASEKIANKLMNLNFNEILSKPFLDEIAFFERDLKSFYKEQHIAALFLPSDVPFFSNLSIRVCRELGIPSFIFLHGLPQDMPNSRYYRSDYLIVYGEKIKEIYVKDGMNPNKIFVSGHPSYKDFRQKELKFSLDNIIVLTKSVSGTDFGDRGNSILYLYSVEKTLRKLGVKSVTLRPHPGENPAWYSRFINTDFYNLSNRRSTRSIHEASLIIGPTSSVLLESIDKGINYLVYEPVINGREYTGRRVFPPFDGSDSRVPVATTEEDLEYLIRNRIKVDSSFFGDYSQLPFDLSFVKKLI